MGFGLHKIVIIGAGHVGSHCAYTLLLNGLARHIVLVDSDRQKAVSQALDLEDCITFAPARAAVSAGDFGECGDADILIMAAGVPRLPGQTRLGVMADTMREMRSIAPKIKKSSFSGVLISISNPCDIVADYLDKALGLPRGRVFGSGTLLDSSRLRGVLSGLTGFDRRSISAFSMGEHGDSQMIPFSCVTCSGRPLLELISRQPKRFGAIVPEEVLARTRMLGMEIIEGKGATEFGIGAAVSDLVRAVLFDERRIFPVSARLTGEYGQSGLHAGVPAVIGRGGVQEIITLVLTESEQMQFAASCAVIKSHIAD